MGTGRINRWLTVSCGSCDVSDSFAVNRDQGRREAVGKWMFAGWQIERPDDAHEDSWWICPKCLKGEG